MKVMNRLLPLKLPLDHDGKRYVVLVAANSKPETIAGVMQSFKSWLEANPEKAKAIANGVAEGVYR